jgi:hypothetical protein
MRSSDREKGKGGGSKRLGCSDLFSTGFARRRHASKAIRRFVVFGDEIGRGKVGLALRSQKSAFLFREKSGPPTVDGRF